MFSCCKKSPPIYEYILNDLSIVKEKLVVLNNTIVNIDYGYKTETLNVEKNDIFKYNINLIHTHKNYENMNVNEYKSTATNNFIKFTCATDSLKISEFIEEPCENIIYGEDERWDFIFNKS